jgi:MFS transporter, PPP family, 3-phenylpropionic acid transporter
VLDRLGHSGAMIGAVLAILPIMRLASAPMWAVVADRWHAGPRILQGAALAVALMMGAMASGMLGIGGFALALVVFAFAWAPISPILDGLTVQVLERAGAPPTRYGRIRLWGSVCYLLIGGAAAVIADAIAWPTAPLVVGAVLLAVGAVVVWQLPPARAETPAPVGPALRLLVARPGVVALLLALTLHGVGLGAYDAWYAMHIQQLGLPSVWTGAALILGVAAEVVVLASAARLLNGRSPLRLVALAFGIAVVRWLLVACLTNPWLLTLIQVSHGAVFGLYWIGAVEALRRLAPPTLRASSQGLLIATTFSLGPLLASLLGALLVDDLGTRALYAAAAVTSAAATALCLLAVARLRRSDEAI